MDPASIEALVTPKTVGIVVVHHGGLPVDLDRVVGIAKRHGLFLIEDCAHAAGARFRDQHVGTFGDVGTFSFHSLKNMTTGEGGMFVTSDTSLYEKAQRLGTIHVWGESTSQDYRELGGFRRPAYYDDWHAQGSYDLDYVGNILIGCNYRLATLPRRLASYSLGDSMRSTLVAVTSPAGSTPSSRRWTASELSRIWTVSKTSGISSRASSKESTSLSTILSSNTSRRRQR